MIDAKRVRYYDPYRVTNTVPDLYQQIYSFFLGGGAGEAVQTHL